jgi:sterol desaturase/sphingolipid hydroxylase (fatty acid hydroxylase superfamily)
MFFTTLISEIGIGWEEVGEFAFVCSVVTLVLLLVRRLERVRPIEQHESEEARAEIATDYKLVLANYFLNWLVGPITAACSVAIVNALGGGILNLEKVDGWPAWVAALLFYLLAYDVYIYWAHRMQHKIPILWALHSFHHSAERITLITGARHLWMETVLFHAFFPTMAVLFTVSPQMAATAQMISLLPDGCSHLNLRFSLGRFKTVLNNPQWHRIHHSTKPEHINKNFARMLPIMDVIFGSAYVPADDEFPATGLTPGERPSLFEGVLWPLRRYLRRAAPKERGA